MSASTAIASTQTGWLVLCTMMLVSRGIFQAAGARRMRAFLDRWKVGSVKRVWGIAALAFALWTVIALLAAREGLGFWDAVLGAALVVVLLADGVANVLPSGFETFKDRTQRVWVERHRGTGRETDEALFATVNLGLAVAAASVAAGVIAYRPISFALILGSVALGIALTAALVLASGRP